jgi:hypothetical protein
VFDAAGPKDQLKMIVRKRPHSLLADHEVVRTNNIAVQFHGGSALDDKCEFQEFLSFCQQSVSQRELIFSWLFNDLRLFVGKSIKMHFPFRTVICQHMVSTIGVDKSTRCGAPVGAPFEKAINSGIS